jgi:long-chain acyl-CoA synthetase
MNVPYVLRRAKRFYGRRTAIYESDRAVSYDQFFSRVMRGANVLRALGIGQGDRVAVLMLNSPRYLEFYYATAQIGAIIVPLNTRWNLDDVVFALQDSGSKLLVLDDRFADWWQPIAGRCPELRQLFAGAFISSDGISDYGKLTADPAADHFDEADPHEDDVVGLFYTSGSTGGPKGVMLTHRNVFTNAMHFCMVSGMNSEWVFLHAAPMFHLADAASVYGLVMTGAAHCFLSNFEPEAFLKEVEQRRVTHSILVPTMINMVVNHPAVEQYGTSSLQLLFYGASPMPLDLLCRAKKKLGCAFAQGYGLSEASPLLTYLAPQDHTFEEDDQPYNPVKSAGRPILGCEVRVVDLHDREVPTGEVGEIVARGPNIMKGYWNRPDINADTLRGGWLHTGDMGVFDEAGYLYVLDRKKDMIKPGSENVYSPEVECAICSHPEVLEAVVIGVPDEKWGEAIKAVVVRRPGRALTEAALIEFCRARLTHFKCPHSVDFMDELPKGGTGKVQKNVLRERYRAAKAEGV